MNTLSLLESVRVLPVVVIRRPEDTLPTLRALEEGGIPAAENTFRTPCAAEAIRTGVRELPQMHIGAGTVINAAQAREALEAGAGFVVSPGLSAEVAGVCREAGVPYLPGCATPTEIMQALALGITTVKFFPANVYGGLEAIRALSAPFPQVRFLPTGGVNEENLRDYLVCDSVAAVGGSFMMKGDIRANCRRIAELLK